MENENTTVNETAVPDAAPKQPAKKRSSKKKKRRAARIGMAVTLSVLLILVVGAAIAAVVGGHRVMQSGKILPNIYIGDIAVGDLTPEQATQTLLDAGWDETHGGTLKVTLPADVDFELDYYEAGVSFTAQQMADFAYRYGREGTDMDALAAYFDSVSYSVDVSDQPLVINEEYIRAKAEDGSALFEVRTAFGEYKLDKTKSVITLLKGGGQILIDRDALTEQIKRALLRHDKELNCSFSREAVSTPDFNQLYEKLHVDPVDAYYDPANDTIIPEVEGFTFDPVEARRLWEEAETADTVTIPVQFLHPTLTASELKDMLFRDLLGTQTTYYRGSTGERINNINLVVQKVNGLILKPGDSFSFNDYIGQRTEEAGFKYAGAYDNGKQVQEIGGGICQTSSTLYNAVLQANLQIDDRTCHYFEVTYLRKGLDATVSWPRPNFQFTNNRDYPIKIVATSDFENRALTFEIWGSNVDGTYCVPTSQWWPMYDQTYPSVQIGWGAVSYREIYDKDGNLIDKIEEAYSIYYLHDEDIHYPAPTPAPAPAPASEPAPETTTESAPDMTVEGTAETES